MSLVFEHIYSLSAPSFGFSVVPKTTGDQPGYIVAGQLDNGTYDQGLLVNTYGGGELYNPDIVNFSRATKRIFKNPDVDYPYIAFGEWLDPWQEKTDIYIFDADNQGVDGPLEYYIGLDNGKNDQVNDVVEYADGASYAAVGNLDGKPTFFTIRYQDLYFLPPVITQGFSSGVTTLSGVCVLPNGQGFAVCGSEFTADGYWAFVAKIDNAGNIVWQKRLSDYSISTDIIATPDGGMLVGGQEATASLVPNYPVLYKLDSNGDYY
jgi:hypothetical protein